MIKNEHILLSNDIIKKLIFDIAIGCQYIHSKLIIHRDIKPDNIFLDKNFTAKIGDFGLAISVNSIEELLHKFCGTPKYQAPEMLLMNGYSFEVDVWAIGCTIYRLFYGNAPFDGIDTKIIFKAILNKSVQCSRQSQYNFIVNKDEINTIKALLKKDPKERMKLNELLEQKKFFPFLNKNEYCQNDVDDNCTNVNSKLKNIDSSSIENKIKFNQMISYLKSITNYETNKRIRINYSNYNDYNLIPKYWIRQWIDIDLFGFGYYFNPSMRAFNFNDNTKMIQHHNLYIYWENLHQIIRCFKNEYCCPGELRKKFNIFQQAFNLLQNQSGFEATAENDNEHKDNGDCFKKNINEYPWLKKWLKTLDAIAFRLNNKLIQINFIQKRKCLIFDPNNMSMTIFNLEKNISLSLNLKTIILNGHVTEKIQHYISIALQYIELIN